MLRTLLILIALIVVIGIALVSFGVVNLSRSGDGTVTLETRDVEVGTTTTNVSMPVVRTEQKQVEVPSIGVADESGNEQ